MQRYKLFWFHIVIYRGCIKINCKFLDCTCFIKGCNVINVLKFNTVPYLHFLYSEKLTPQKVINNGVEGCFFGYLCLLSFPEPFEHRQP
ncbi:MAG: hypothetical protein RIS47_571 [Bacteroidota bacterium]|jgi:hypothetical protein